MENEETFLGFDAYFQRQWTGSKIKKASQQAPHKDLVWLRKTVIKDGLKTTSAVMTGQ